MNDHNKVQDNRTFFKMVFFVTVLVVMLLSIGFDSTFLHRWTANHHDVLSGYREETCTTVVYDIDYASTDNCHLYAIDSCSIGEYRQELVRDTYCLNAILGKYVDKSPIGSKHTRYHFNNRPQVYYNQEQLAAFIQENNNPLTLLSTVTITTWITSSCTIIIFLCFILKYLNRRIPDAPPPVEVENKSEIVAQQ